MKNKQLENIKSGTAILLELEILKILCHHGPSTLPFVIEELAKHPELDGNDTLSILHHMANEGYILLVASPIVSQFET